MSKKRRFPDFLVMNINSLIRAAAYELRAEKKAAAAEASGDEDTDIGIKNFEIVERVKDEVHKLFARHYLALTEHYLSTQVSLVLEGRMPERRISIMALPGLPEIAEWLAVPSPEDKKAPDSWKVPLDCSPNELKRIEDRRRARGRAEIEEAEKLRIVRTTAEAKGCDPDEPISTVFDEKPSPPAISPDLHP